MGPYTCAGCGSHWEELPEVFPGLGGVRMHKVEENRKAPTFSWKGMVFNAPYHMCGPVLDAEGWEAWLKETGLDNG